MRKPSHLYKDAYGKYEALEKLVRDKLKEGDENLLAVLANSYVDYRKASAEFNNRGPVQAGETMTRKNPAFDIMKDSIKIIESLSQHFGFSPKSRGEKFGNVVEKTDPLKELLNES